MAVIAHRRDYRDRLDDDREVVTVDSGPNIIARVIWFITGLILLLLAFRFILSLLGANRSNGFATLIYDWSHPFVAPFFNLFNYNNIIYGISRFEVYTLFAMLVYLAIGWALVYLATIGDRRQVIE